MPGKGPGSSETVAALGARQRRPYGFRMSGTRLSTGPDELYKSVVAFTIQQGQYPGLPSSFHAVTLLPEATCSIQAYDWPLRSSNMHLFCGSFQVGLDLLVPSRCKHCLAALSLPGSLCLACFRVLETCRIPDWELPGFTPQGRPVSAISYYRGGSPLRAVHRAAKYGQDMACARWLGHYASRRMGSRQNFRPASIVGVPSHPARLRERGLDVVDELACVLSQHLSTPKVQLIERVRLGTPQRFQDRIGRVSNVEGVFRSSGETIADQRPSGPVLLFDDVVTTGATMDACASVLESQGYSVVLLALAFRRELFAG